MLAPHPPAMLLTPAAALLMIVSGSLHAIVNAILKGGRDKMAGRALIDGSSALFILPAVALVPLPHGAWGYLFATGALHTAYLYALVRAFENGDLSAAYPVLRGTAPLVTAAVTIGLLGEPHSAAQIAGIALIGFGVLMMVSGRHLDRATLGWSVLTGVLIAVFTVFDAAGVRAAPTPESFIAWFFLIFGAMVFTVFGLLSRDRFLESAKRQWRAGAAAGFFSILSFGLALYALSMGPTAPLAALRETGMVTALLISIFVLRERVTPGRILGIAAILGGAMLIIGGR